MTLIHGNTSFNEGIITLSTNTGRYMSICETLNTYSVESIKKTPQLKKINRLKIRPTKVYYTNQDKVNESHYDIFCLILPKWLKYKPLQLKKDWAP